MPRLSSTFLGQTNKVANYGSIEITESQYSGNNIDWHFHENPHFTFLLAGVVIDGNRTQKQHCSPGTLLFHNWQEPHYNLIQGNYAKSLHIGLKTYSEDNLTINRLPIGRMTIQDPAIKILFYQIHKELQLGNKSSIIGIESLFVNAVTRLNCMSDKISFKTPPWVNKVKDVLYNLPQEGITLNYLAKEAGIHPVHLSRQFSKYFNCSLGDYIRKIRIEKALKLFFDDKRSLTEIAFDCGFADQSHFLRCFKEIFHTSPSAFRKYILEQKKEC